MTQDVVQREADRPGDLRGRGARADRPLPCWRATCRPAARPGSTRSSPCARSRAASPGPRPKPEPPAILSPPWNIVSSSTRFQQGALEIQYIEEFFLDFPRKKTAVRGHSAPVRSRSSDPDGGGAAARRSRHGRAGLVQGVARAARERAAIRSWPISSPSSRTASSSTAAACCISGLAAREATGAARGISAR